MKFRHIILTCFIIFSLLPLYVLGGLALYQNNKIIKETVSDNLKTLNRSQITYIETFCENIKMDFDLLCKTDIIQDAFLTDANESNADIKRAYAGNLLQEYCSSYDYLCSLSLVDKKYTLVSSSEPFGSDTPVASPDVLFQDGLYMGQVMEDKTGSNGERVIDVFTNVYRDDTLIGYLIAEIPISYFDTFCQRLELADGCIMYITDKNNNIITAEASDTFKDPLNYLNELVMKPEFLQKWDAIDWDTDSSGIIEYTENKKDYLNCYSNLKYSDWKICINADLSQSYQAALSFRTKLFIGMFYITICLLMINAYLSLRLTKPLEMVSNTLLRAREKEDYTLRVERPFSYELGVLANQVNELLAYVYKMRQLEEQQILYLQERVVRDPLTNAYNKNAIGDFLDNMLSQAGDSEVYVGFIDVDDFRDFNTKYGHAEGDRVLMFVADTMKQFFGDGVGRNGGDEFLFWAEKHMSDEEFEQSLTQFLKTLNAYSVSCSIGVAVESAASADAKTIIRHADEAMYHTKEHGKNSYYILHF